MEGGAAKAELEELFPWGTVNSKLLAKAKIKNWAEIKEPLPYFPAL